MFSPLSHLSFKRSPVSLDMPDIRRSITLLVVAFALTAEAQQADTIDVEHPLLALANDTIVIIDLETALPLRDVKLFTNTGAVRVSDYRGRIVLPDSTFQSATLSHAKYLNRVLERVEISDTLEMLPKGTSLGDVVVWGEDRRGIKKIVGMTTKDLSAYAPPGGVASFDFFELFRKKPLSRKIRKKNKELLENWEKIY